MNVITITGNLGRDIEVRTTPAGDQVGGFSVADSQGKDKPTIWWNCQLWGKRVDSLGPYLLKGQKVTVTGTVTEREWSDKEGNKRKSMDVRVSDIDPFCGGKAEARPQDAAPAQAPRPASASSVGGFADMDDDVPFANPLRSRTLCLAI